MSQAVVDSHIHFWDPGHLRYAWLANAPAINRPFLPADLRRAAAGVDVQGIVFVECGLHPDDRLAEVAWVSKLAGQEPRIQAIVAAAPLEQGPDAARPHLEALAHSPLVRGIRRMIQSEAPGFGVQPAFVAAVQTLPDYGFSFDICIRHRQAADAICLVEQCPGVAFILDHFAKPAVQEGRLDPWRDDLRRLAGFPNVVCKLSGLATEADHQRWSQEQLKPYIDHALDSFGPDRVLYGGDWPVSTQAIGYTQWIDVLSWATAERSEADRRKLFVENTRRIYRLP
ncbi:MAG: amidohydrolase family protein [Caldilineaceae bacterium]|nr:amidohydrolase family protein [Caldilineaceae bacterium]